MVYQFQLCIFHAINFVYFCFHERFAPQNLKFILSFYLSIIFCNNLFLSNTGYLYLENIKWLNSDVFQFHEKSVQGKNMTVAEAKRDEDYCCRFSKG